MRTYIGVPIGSSAMDHQVFVEDHAGNIRVLNSRLDLRNHSPTGLCWGYGGSGPAQLALALLCDAFIHHLELQPGAPHDTVTRRAWCERLALEMYQHFKDRHVAGWPQTVRWRYTVPEIVEMAQELPRWNQAFAAAERTMFGG